MQAVLGRSLSPPPLRKMPVQPSRGKQSPNGERAGGVGLSIIEGGFGFCQDRLHQLLSWVSSVSTEGPEPSQLHFIKFTIPVSASLPQASFPQVPVLRLPFP